MKVELQHLNLFGFTPYHCPGNVEWSLKKDYLQFHDRVAEMRQEPIYDQEIQNIEPDKDWAKVIVRVTPPFVVEKVNFLIERIGIDIVKVEYLSNRLVVFTLGTKDIRTITLMLAENGFTAIKGVNALTP